MQHNIWKHVVRSIILGGLFFGAAYSPAVDRFAGDSPISLNVKNEPLGDVLEKIGQATGYQISVSESWADMPVTATFKDVPLQKGLKRILGNTNNAIIYGAGGKIKIVIYDKASAGGRALNLPAGPSYPQQPYVGSQPVPAEPPTPAERDEGTEASEETQPESSQPAQQSRGGQEQGSKVRPQTPESGSGQQESQSTEETPGQSSEESTEQQQQRQPQQGQ